MIGAVPHQQIPNLEISLISVTTVGKSIDAGYLGFRWLLELATRQGQAADVNL